MQRFIRAHIITWQQTAYTYKIFRDIQINHDNFKRYLLQKYHTNTTRNTKKPTLRYHNKFHLKH
jgi:hypothetical protein